VRQELLSQDRGALDPPLIAKAMFIARRCQWQRGRRKCAAIGSRWHRLVDADEQLTTASSISRTQFYDHIPQVLEAYEHRLRAEHVADKQAAAAEQRKSAAEHGLHRWQQGYNQLETMREWAHLQLCLLDELEVYEAEHAGLDPGVMRTARRALVRLCGDGVCESAARYARSQQSEAASRLHELEQAVVHLQSMERERAERWREAAHDLRSTVGVVTNVAAVLTRTGIPETARVAMSQALQRGTASLRDLLVDLMDLSRLEAGQERRNIASFDVAKMLREFSEPLRALAAQRNLFFRTDGVESLLIEGDSAKVQRIAQNLVMNAFKATVQGGLRLTWEERNPTTCSSGSFACRTPGRDSLAGASRRWSARCSGPPRNRTTWRRRPRPTEMCARRWRRLRRYSPARRATCRVRCTAKG
jgi:signal transduction histidine kinase